MTLNRTSTNWQRKFNQQASQLYNDLALTNWETANVGEYKPVADAVKDWGISGTYKDASGNDVPLDFDLVSLENNTDGGYNVIGYRYDKKDPNRIIRTDQAGMSYLDANFNPTGESYTWEDIAAGQQAEELRQSKINALQQSQYYDPNYQGVDAQGNAIKGGYNIQGAVTGGLLSEQDAADLFGSDWNAPQPEAPAPTATPDTNYSPYNADAASALVTTAVNAFLNGASWDSLKEQGYDEKVLGQALVAGSEYSFKMKQLQPSFYANLFDGVITDEEVQYGQYALSNPDTQEEFLNFLQQQGKNDQSVKYLKQLVSDLTDAEIDQVLGVTSESQTAQGTIPDGWEVVSQKKTGLNTIFNNGQAKWSDALGDIVGGNFPPAQFLFGYNKDELQPTNPEAKPLYDKFVNGKDGLSLDEFEQLSTLTDTDIPHEVITTQYGDREEQRYRPAGTNEKMLSQEIVGGASLKGQSGYIPILSDIVNGAIRIQGGYVIGATSEEGLGDIVNAVMVMIPEGSVTFENIKMLVAAGKTSKAAEVAVSWVSKNAEQVKATIKNIPAAERAQSGVLKFTDESFNDWLKYRDNLTSKTNPTKAEQKVLSSIDDANSIINQFVEKAKIEGEGNNALARQRLNSMLDMEIDSLEKEMGNRSLPYHGAAKTEAGTKGLSISEIQAKWNELRQFKETADSLEFYGTPKTRSIKIPEGGKAPEVSKDITKFTENVSKLTTEERAAMIKAVETDTALSATAKTERLNILKQTTPTTGTTIPKEGKQAWEMTKDELVDSRMESLRNSTMWQNSPRNYQKTIESSTRIKAENEWYKLNENAYIDGETVPLSGRPDWSLTAKQVADRSDDTLDKYIIKSHDESVKKAIDEGLPVPKEALNDYQSRLPPKEIQVDDDVVWHSPFTNDDTVMNFRGYNGDKAVIYNKKSGFQTQVPKDQIKSVPESVLKDYPDLKPTVKENLTVTPKVESGAIPEVSPAATEVKGTAGNGKVPPESQTLSETQSKGIAAQTGEVKPPETIADLATTNPEVKAEVDNAVKKIVDSPEVSAGLTAEEKTVVENKVKQGFEPPKPPEKPPVVAKMPDGKPNNPVNKLIDVIKKAKRLSNEERSEAELMRHNDKVQRVAIAYKKLQSGDGKAAFDKARSALGGKYDYPVFEAPQDVLSSEDINALYKQVQDSVTSGKTQYFEGDATQEALTKLLGGEMPTEREIGLLEKMFGPELASEIMKKQSLGKVAWREFVGFLNIPRAFLSSFDLSAPFRQGIVLMMGQPKEFWTSYGKMFTTIFSEKNAQLLDETIKNNRFFKIADESELYIAPFSSANITRYEEAFMSKWADKLPGIKQSNRAYVSFLNKLRTDTFYSYCKAWENTGASPEQYRKLAQFVNWATGRGPLPKVMQGAGSVFNAAFFSPRFAASRLAIPLTVLEKNPAVRKIAIKNLSAFVGTGIGVLGLIQLTGVGDVELDPRSTDFGKIRVGDTRYDFWGGFQPWARTIAQVITGQRKTTTTGDVYDINRLDTIIRFLRSKESPIFGLVSDLLSGQTLVGEDMTVANVPSQLKERLIPLVIQDIWDATAEYGIAGTAKAIPAFFGMGTQTYRGDAWRENELKLGQPISSDMLPFSLENKIYTTKNFYSDTMGQIKNVPIADMDEKYGFTPKAISVAEARDISQSLDTISSTALKSINADTAKGDTFEQYYNQWQERSNITDPDKLKEFDKQYPHASQGNMTLRQLDLLRQYNKLSDEDKKQFLKDNPELSQDARTEWLKSHPKENAQLAIWGQAKILTPQAYKIYQDLKVSLDIPDAALPDAGVPPTQELADSHFKYQALVDKYGLTDPEAELMLINNKDLATFEETLSTHTLSTVPVPVLQIDIKNRDINAKVKDMTDEQKAAFLLTDEGKKWQADEWRKDYYAKQYSWDNTEGDSQMAESYVAYYQKPEGNARLLDRYDDPALNDWGVKLGIWKPLDPDQSVDALRLKVTNSTLDPKSAEYKLNEVKITAYNDGQTQEEVDAKVAQVKPMIDLEVQYQPQFDQQDKLKTADGDSEETKASKQAQLDTLLASEVSPGVTFQDVLYKREVYKQLMPDNLVEPFVTWSQAAASDKSTLSDYAGDRVLQANPELYATLRAKNIITKDINFNSLPSAEIDRLNEVYKTIASTIGRNNFLKVHPELADWMSLREAYTKYNMPDTLAPKYVEWKRENKAGGWSDERYLLENPDLYTEMVKQGIVAAFPAVIVPSEQVEFEYDVYLNTPWASTKAKERYLKGKTNLQKWIKTVAAYKSYLKSKELQDKYGNVK